MAADRFSDPNEARKKAMDYLARREYGRGELLDKVVRFGFDPGVAERAVDQLAGEGLQSDRRFAEALVHSRIRQGKGPVVIRADLGRRGVDEAVVALAIEQAGEDWIELARSVRRKKFGQDVPAGFPARARQMRFLQSRGFDAELIRAAMGGEPD